MKRTISLCLLMAGLALATASCEKDGMVYEATDGLYFLTDSTVYTFVDKPSSLIKDTVTVELKLIGRLADNDREVRFRVDSTNATQDVDFVMLQPALLQKQTSILQFKIVLNRTENIQTAARNVWFSMDASENFVIDSASYPRLQHKLVFSDRLERPSWWNTHFSPFSYSTTRMQFYIDVFGSVKAPTTNATTGIGIGLGAALYMLKHALNDYNASHPQPLSDEFGLINWSHPSYE